MTEKQHLDAELTEILKHLAGWQLDPKYADVIVNRWQNFTGRDATLAGDGRTFNQIKAEAEATK